MFSHIAAEASAITHPNRYLLIATSGGLNQQRTGVMPRACIFLVDDFVLHCYSLAIKIDQEDPNETECYVNDNRKNAFEFDGS